MKPAVIGGVVLLLLVIIGVFMLSQEPSSTTDNKNDTPADEPDPVAEAGGDDKPAAKMAAEQEVLADAKEEQGDEKEKEKETEDKDAVKELPPKDEPATKPSEISGLVGWFEPKNFSYKKGQWKDSSGKGNHATEIKGRPEKVSEDGVTFVMGGNATGIRFPTKCMTRGRKFTMFTVASDTTAGAKVDSSKGTAAAPTFSAGSTGGVGIPTDPSAAVIDQGQGGSHTRTTDAIYPMNKKLSGC